MIAWPRDLLPGLSRPILIAHAGGTLLSGGALRTGIERAIAAGVEMVEIDVRRTADEVLVVHHGGAPGAPVLQARRYAEVASDKLPALTDALAWIDGRVAVDVELKEAGYEDAVLATCLQHIAHDRLLVTSFLDGAVRAASEAAATVARGLIVGRRPTVARLRGTLRDVFPFGPLRSCDADVLVSSRPLDVTAIRRRAARHDVPAIVWTINERRALHRALRDERLLGVMTDRYDLAPRAGG